MEWVDSRGERRLLQPLWSDGERLYCRTWRNNAEGAEHALIAVLPAAEHPASTTISGLAHEFALKDYLDGAWAARPLELVRSRGRTLLLLECRGTGTLDSLLGKPLELEVFLKLAPAITHAVGRLHERGLVHKDIKPAHILLDPVTEEVWLTGFGSASRLPRERQVPEPPEFIAGTLAYTAPEQTGRMNRSTDSRGDLYSLGITFYQMLTSSLPFAATDPMELVHCHIARTPVPPHERVGNIPALISQIVMKLVAKTAEERYQTAAGVEHDLRRCLAEWEMRGRIDEFPLAEHDVTDRLLIPERLYGRSREVAVLLSAFHRPGVNSQLYIDTFLMLALNRLVSCASNAADARKLKYAKGSLPNWRLKRALHCWKATSARRIRCPTLPSRSAFTRPHFAGRLSSRQDSRHIVICWLTGSIVPRR